MFYPSIQMLQPAQTMFVYFLVPQQKQQESPSFQPPICQKKEKSQPAILSSDLPISNKGTQFIANHEDQREEGIQTRSKKFKKDEDEEEFIPNMPETNKRRRNSQNQNRNVFSFMLKSIRSGKLVQKILQQLLQNQVSEDAKKFNVESKVNNYVNQDSLLILNEFQDLTFTVYSKKEQLLYIKICRIIVFHFLTYNYDLTILTSKRMKSEKKRAHLQAKTKLIEHLHTIFSPTLLHQRIN